MSRRSRGLGGGSWAVTSGLCDALDDQHRTLSALIFEQCRLVCKFAADTEELLQCNPDGAMRHAPHTPTSHLHTLCAADSACQRTCKPQRSITTVAISSFHDAPGSVKSNRTPWHSKVGFEAHSGTTFRNSLKPPTSVQTCHRAAQLLSVCFAEVAQGREKGETADRFDALGRSRTCEAPHPQTPPTGCRNRQQNGIQLPNSQ